MYPRIDFGNVHISVFGIFLAISWLVFFYFLHKYSVKRGISKHIFSDIVFFTFSIFFFARLFYIIAQWRTEKFIFVDLINGGSWMTFFGQFFTSPNYNLSFVGGVFGFFLVFFIKTAYSKYRGRYLDIIVISFFLAAIIGYIGTLLGGQIYGTPFESFFSLTYNNKYSPVAFQQQTFPLPVLYILVSAGLFVATRHMLAKNLSDGYVGLLMMGIFGFLIFILEFTSGREDMIQGYFFGLNLNQVLALIFISSSFVWITRFFRK